ncbi:hypothetical protein A3F07_04265 [candidate division WWE3 bacterium RIFCSPHIGHO2_12_FULL_38_15]|nr:MAG: hypothetical protein A3F07_04265 [candidate division WWE3 bacterium RIFCSPHIGHO2_12_FULL_38_15]OGC53859.1 MAG: hypothetical protein A3B64_00780 [candidate division WWE3 bacterium RIFCSPLOWO2_01_FULL_37_24]HLB51843.1 sulfite exporter TauE/SafE family protein [Patescibacteria group bacterium]
MNKQKKHITYYVHGMHCASCESLIEKTIKGKEGVVEVNASLKHKRVEIHFNDTARAVNINDINNDLKELGYTFSKDKPDVNTFSNIQKSRSLIIAAVVILIFIIIERNGALRSFSVSRESDLFSFFIFGLAAGISSCAALVGGLLLSLSKQWTDAYGGNKTKIHIPFIMFNLGRLLSFALLGGLLGILGSVLKFSIESTAVLTIFISLIMLILGLQMAGVHLANKITIRPPKSLVNNIVNGSSIKGKYVPFLIGGATFFIPCGFTLIAQTSALNTGDIYKSAAMMTAFSLGTLPALAVLSFTSIKLHTNTNLSVKFNYIVGILVVFFAIYTFNSQLNVLGAPSLNDLKKVFDSKQNYLSYIDNSQNDLNNKEFQVMQMEASEFEYYPKEIILKVGIPVKWEFYNRGAVGCANAVSARGLYSGIISLKRGMNVFEFTPKNTGTYKITCSMGMVEPVTVRVI